MEELKIGVIGGSGLGEAFLATAQGDKHEVQTPFGRPSDAIIHTEWAGVPVYFLARHGPGHLLNPSRVPYQANIFALKKLGCTHVIASGAVGSLRDEFKPRDLVIPDQLIDKTHKRANTFYDHAAVHVEFAQPFCQVLRQTLIEAGKLLTADPAGTPAFTVHDRSCYVAMEGPAFSTRAESLMHRLWGGDLVGMTAMPEARLAREAELSYALVALVTDYDSWKKKADAAPTEVKLNTEPEKPADPSELLQEIIGHLQAASNNGIALIKKTIELMANRKDALLAAPSRQSLKLAIWSDRSKIDNSEIDRLAALWGRHFEA